jgi:type IV secretion system protein VirD4
MTPLANRSTLSKAAVVGVVALCVVGVWAYLAGGMMMLAFDRPYEDATPLTFLQYWYYYRTTAQVERWLWISGVLSAVICLAPGALFFPGEKRTLFGDARFATRREVAKAGLYGDKGIIVGQHGGKYLMFDGMQHVIITAPTRSGKGVSFVIPNLLTWPDSTVVLDIKQENWDLTSGYRAKRGQACFLFNPTAKDYRSHRWNPLGYISDDANFRIDDVQKIAGMLFPDKEGTDLIWTATPRSLFMGIVLMLAETPDKPVTLGQVLRETLVDGDGSKYFASLINDRAQASNPFSSACVRGLNSYVSISSENTRSGVIAGFRSSLELWNNPLVDAATSANDFDLREIRKKRMSIYIGVTPDNLKRVRPLLNLFLQQLVDLNTQELPSQNKAIRYTCALFLDEFTAIGKMPVLSDGISFIAGYLLRMAPIIQSPSQVDDTYGKESAKTFMVNHALRIVFPPKATETEVAKDISEWLGYQTVKGTSHSRGSGWFTKKQKSESTSDQRRALMLPQEITSMKGTDELVVTENLAPVLAKKVVYYADPVFMDRLKSVSPSLRSLGKRLPNKAEMDAAAQRGELAAAVPLIDMSAHNRSAGTQDAPVTVSMPAVDGKRIVTVERQVTAAELPNLAMLSLKDFAINFTASAPVLTGETLADEAALVAYADQLCRDAGIAV